MIIQIQSNNPKLLDILNKNPNTDFGIYAKLWRNGQIIGNALNSNRYDVIFQDTRYSYLPEESNQIDFQSYCSPLVILHICNELFKELLQERETYFNQTIKWLNQIKQEVDTEDIANPNNVKVVVNKNGDALYFSRAFIPFPRDEKSEGIYFKHIGIYAYRKHALMQFTQLGESMLEKTEKLEQLRYLENGFRIRLAVTDISTVGIDTESDLEKARNLWFSKKRN